MLGPRAATLQTVDANQAVYDIPIEGRAGSFAFPPELLPRGNSLTSVRVFSSTGELLDTVLLGKVCGG